MLRIITFYICKFKNQGSFHLECDGVHIEEGVEPPLLQGCQDLQSYSNYCEAVVRGKIVLSMQTISTAVFFLFVMPIAGKN